MRVITDVKADARYIWLSDEVPVSTVEVGEGTVVDLDSRGALIGLAVICIHRDWTVPLEGILGSYPVSAADAERLRLVAAVRA